MRPLALFFEIGKDRNEHTCLLKVEIEDLYCTNRQKIQINYMRFFK